MADTTPHDDEANGESSTSLESTITLTMKAFPELKVSLEFNSLIEVSETLQDAFAATNEADPAGDQPFETHAMDEQESSGEVSSGKSIKHKDEANQSLNNISLESNDKTSNFNRDKKFLQLSPLNFIMIKDLSNPFDPMGWGVTESQTKEILKSATDLISEVDESSRVVDQEKYKIYNPFVICRKIHHDFNESMFPGNLPDFRNQTIVKFGEDGLLYQNNKVLDSLEEGAWALNPKGKMCVFFRDKFPNITAQTHHSFFFKKDGIAKPVACAGNIEVHNGKIIRINNDSGRYQPHDIQLLLAVKYLFLKGVMDHKVRGELVVKEKNLSLEEMIIIEHYLDLK